MIIISQRNTVQKALILRTVRSMTNHPTADEVYEKVSKSYPAISKATVYRDLKQFAEDGKILKVAVANAPDRYDFTTENHVHSLCSSCGKVFDYKLQSEPKLDNDSNPHFIANSYDMIVNGICTMCRKEGNTSNG